MAQPSNTYDSYDMVGIREDLEDMIYDISPDETPFYTKASKAKAKNTFHEWQTDALRSSAVNAHIEGDDTVADAMSATSRLGNYTQIFKNAVVIPGTDVGLNKAGRAREMAYQVLKIAKEQKLDIEKAMFANQEEISLKLLFMFLFSSGSAATLVLLFHLLPFSITKLRLTLILDQLMNAYGLLKVG